MMMAGVPSVLLAAATAALPFTPPAGWVQLPQSAVGAHVSMWTGPKHVHGGPLAFTAIAFPFPGSVDTLAQITRKRNSAKLASGSLTQLSNVPVNLCGTKGRMVTNRVRGAGVTTIVQQEVAVKNGYAYMLLYTRPVASAADRGVTHAMRAFCPSGVDSVSRIGLPGGWAKSAGDLEMAGTWMGPRPGEMLILMRGSQMASLDQVFASAQKQSTTMSSKTGVNVTQHKAVSMCGYPGMRVDMNVTAATMPISVHTAVTQGNGTAYVLTYTDIGSTNTDPTALAALQTLCVSGGLPLPSTSPLPSPSASASAAPSPSPSATP